MCVFDIVVSRELLAYARNHELLLYHVQPGTLELHGPIFHYQASQYIDQVKLIEIPSSSRILVVLQVGLRVEYAWLEMPHLKASTSYPLYTSLKVHVLTELEKTVHVSFIYIPYENRLAVFGDEEIFVTEAIKDSVLSLRKVCIPMQTEVGALVNYIPLGKESTTNICVTYESRFKAERGTAHLGKALLMTRLDKQTELPDIQWCEWDFKAMKLRVNWRLVSLGSDQIPHVMFGVSDENEAEEYALIFCKPKLEVYNDSGKQFNLELDSSIHITSLAIVPVDKVHASTMGFVYFFASCVYGEFRLGKIDLYDSKITWIGSVMSLKVLDLYDDIHSCIEMMPAVQSMKIIAGTLQDTQKNPSPYLPTTHSFVPDGRLVALCYHPIYGTQVAVQVDAESGNHPFPAHTFSSWNLHFSEARGVMNPALPIHRGLIAMNAPTVSIQQPMGDVVTKSFVAPQVLLVDHGLQMKVSSSTVLDLGHVMDSKIVPVQPIATSNLEAGMQSNVAVMLTSRRHQVSTMLAYNIVQSTYSPMDKITGLKTEQHTIAAYNLGSGITLQVTSGSLSAVAGNNSSNKLLWTANIHALLAKYLSGQHTAIVYELRKENANILASCMVPNILYLSFKKYVLAVFIACEQVGQSSSSGDITQGGVLISCINRMDLWSMDQEISHIYGTYSKTLSVFGVAMWDNGSDPDKYLELHYYKIPPKTSSSKSSMLTKHTTNLPVHLPRGFIKSFLLISMATDIDNNVFCAVMATSDNMLRIVSFTFDTTKDEISCKYLECYELQAGVENLVELSNLNTPRLIVSTSVGNYLLLLIVREKVKIESHLIPLTQSLIESRKSVSFFPIPNFNKESRDDVMQRVGYFFADSVDGTGVIEGKLYHSDIDISQILAPASSILTGNGHLRLRGNPLQSLPVDGSILGHCYNSHDGCLFLLSQTLPNGSNDNKARNRDQVLSIFSRCNTSYRFEFRFSLTMEEILKRYLCFDEEALAHYDKASKIVGIYQYPDSYMMGQSHNRGNGTQIFHLIFYDSWFAEDDVNEATPTEDWNFDLEHVIMNTLYIVSFAYDFQSTNTIQGLKYLTFHTFDFFDPALMHYYNNSHIKHIGDGILDSQRIAVQPITAFRSEDVPVHEENIIDDSYMCILTPEGRLCIFGWSAQITKKAANDLVEIDEIEVDVKDFTSYQRDHVTSLNTNILASCYVFSKESEDIYFYFNAHEEKYSSASTSTQHSRKEVRGELNFEINSGTGHQLLNMSIHDSMIAVTIPMYGVRLFQLNSIGLRDRTKLQLQFVGEYKDPSSRMLFPTLVIRRNPENGGCDDHVDVVKAVAKLVVLNPGSMLEEKDNDINWYQTFSFTFLKDKAESEDDVLKATAEGSMLQVFEFGEMRVQHARCPRPSLFVQQHLNHISPHQIGVENDSTHLLTWAKKLNAQHVYEQDLLLMNTMGDMLVQL